MAVDITYQSGFSVTVTINSELAYTVNPDSESLARASKGYILLTHLSDGIIDALQLVTQPVITCRPITEALEEKTPELLEKLDITTYEVGQQDNYPHGLLSVVDAPNKTNQPACGFVLEAEGNQIYHAGPIHFDHKLRDVGREFKPNFSLIPISKNHITDKEMVQVPMWLGSDFIMPLQVWQSDSEAVDMSEVFQAVDIYSPAICRILNPGETYTLQKIEDTGRTIGPEARY